MRDSYTYTGTVPVIPRGFGQVLRTLRYQTRRKPTAPPLDFTGTLGKNHYPSSYIILGKIIRRFPVLLLIPALAAMYAGCKSFSTCHLVLEKAADAKTALAIDTDFFSTHDTQKNGFNLKCEDMSKEECNEVMTCLKAAGPEGPALFGMPPPGSRMP